MLKIISVIVFLAPGGQPPQVFHKDMGSYEECLGEVEKVRAKAAELNAKGGDFAEFKVLAGCEFSSEKSDPT